MKWPKLSSGVLLVIAVVLIGCRGNRTNEPAPLAAPFHLAYMYSTSIYTKGLAIPANSPTSQGGAVAVYSVNPNLPTGLNLSATTGVISGTPLGLSSAFNYVVTGTNSAGSTTATLTITAIDVAPRELAYSTSPATYLKDLPINPNMPTNAGGPVTSYSVEPPLPVGLTLDSSTGVIAGLPTTRVRAANYRVTASNSGGNTTANLTITVNFQPEVATTIDYQLSTLTTPRPSNIYALDFQGAIQNEIDVLKTKRTPAQPLLLMDPFGTNILSLYAYFVSINDCYVEYNIDAEIDGLATSTFSRRVENKNPTKQHEFRIIGLVPGVMNQVTIKLFAPTDEELFAHQFSVFAPDLYLISQVLSYPKKLNAIKSGTPSEGLFITAGQRQPAGSFWSNSSLLIDNEGIVRGQITIPSNYNPRIEFYGNKMIYACTLTDIAVVNTIGKVEKIFSTAPYSIHHDLILDGESILALVDGDGQVEDLIYKIDMESNTGSLLFNLRHFFPGYDYTKNGKDWLHSNALSLINESNGTKSLLISAREISTILKINDIYSTYRTPYIKYIISDNGSINPYMPRLERKCTVPNHKLIPNLGQHSITYLGPEDSSVLDNEKYFIHFFNNNSIHNGSGIDWTLYLAADLLAEVGNSPLIGTKSMFQVYLVDEIKATAELVKSIDVGYSGVMGSSQHYETNFIVASANQYKIYEYDVNGKLLLKISFDNDDLANQPAVYRVFKYRL